MGMETKVSLSHTKFNMSVSQMGRSSRLLDGTQTYSEVCFPSFLGGFQATKIDNPAYLSQT